LRTDSIQLQHGPRYTISTVQLQNLFHQSYSKIMMAALT